MSDGEVAGAYIAGRISRRTLIRRLVAGGVSLGAAVSYAHLLDPGRAGASSALVADDLYPLVDMRIDPTDLAWVVSRKRIRVVVSSTEEVSLGFRAFIRRGPGLRPVGFRFYSNFLTGPGKAVAQIPIDTTLLEGRTSAVAFVAAQGTDGERYPAICTAKATLK